MRFSGSAHTVPEHWLPNRNASHPGLQRHPRGPRRKTVSNTRRPRPADLSRKGFRGVGSVFERSIALGGWWARVRNPFRRKHPPGTRTRRRISGSSPKARRARADRLRPIDRTVQREPREPVPADAKRAPAKDRFRGRLLEGAGPGTCPGPGRAWQDNVDRPTAGGGCSFPGYEQCVQAVLVVRDTIPKIWLKCKMTVPQEPQSLSK